MTEHYLNKLARTINENWDAPALTDFYLTEDGTIQDTSRGNHYTYGEMYMEMLRLRELFKELGLKKGDHIAICGANSAHWAIAYLAIAAYQGVSVTILHTQSSEDIAYQIDFSDAKALFTNKDLWRELKDLSLPQIKQVVSLENWHILYGEDTQNPIQKLGVGEPNAYFELGDAEDLAMICFTSGSTSVSKGVMLSYKNVDGNVNNALETYPKDTNTNALSMFPFSHMLSVVCEVITQLIKGNLIHIICAPLSFNNIATCLSYVRPIAFCGVPIVIQTLFLKYFNNLDDYMKHTCQLVLIGGAHIPQDIEKRILNAGWPLSTGYGQTETGGCVSLSNSSLHRISSCGKVTRELTAKIIDNELCVKGSKVMLGYYKNPEATAQKIDADGWLHTGDRGYLDEDGYLYVEGRLEQDMIVLPNGENIHPDNIERKINALPEVAESIVIARGGNLVAIVVPSSVEHQDLRRFILRTINPQLPSYSQLYDVECINEPLARTAKQTLKRYLYK